MSQQVARRRATDQLTPATVSFTPPKGFAAIEGRDHHVTFPVIGRRRSGENTLRAFGSMGFVVDEFTRSMFVNPDYHEHLLKQGELYNVVLVPTVSMMHYAFNDCIDAICERFEYSRVPGDIVLECCSKIDDQTLWSLQAEFLLIGHTPIETVHGQPCVFGMTRSDSNGQRNVTRFATSGDINPYGAIALWRH